MGDLTQWHISRSWNVDPFAPGCGCELLPCGHVPGDLWTGGDDE